ncbi:hypothetical protein PspLS_05375 [Pyricularia sp. CBS 133598]|nr:hypothetical protein PspLS_05375 [Pyricularia sp. CBS 133598]
MTSIESKIQAAAAENDTLLQTLRETDHAAPDLDNQNKFIADLDRQILESSRVISELDRKRNKELKDHEKYRDSVMRRFAYKATGKREKFTQRADKEEKEYFEVLQQCHREAESRKGLEQMLRDAHDVKAELEEASRRHRQAQLDLDGLYSSIFEGPTPAFPEEDRIEEVAREARDNYHQARVRCEGEQRALQLLEQAWKSMSLSVRMMQEAVSASHWDMFGGGSMADAMERSALHKADIAVRDARMLAMQAQKQSPSVNLDSIPNVQMAQGSIMSDVFFDNIFTDMAFHEKIRQSQQQVHRCLDAHTKLVKESKERYDQLKGELKEREVMLSSARSALQEARAEVFRRIGGSIGETQMVKA